MAIGGIIGVASTIGVCYANKINPWTGTPNNYRKPGEYRIWGTQKGLNKEMVDFYYSQMKDGVFDNLKIRVYDYHGELFISDGHCRMTAAFMYYNETGSTYYIELLINNAKKTQLNPADYGFFKNWFLWK